MSRPLGYYPVIKLILSVKKKKKKKTHTIGKIKD